MSLTDAHPTRRFVSSPWRAARRAGVVFALGTLLASAAHAQSPEIIGGTVAKAGKWPFVVSLVDRNTSDNKQAAYCGGTLISPRDVLTAAHCLGPYQKVDVKNIQVLVGTQDLTTGGQRIDVARAIRHPNYQASTYESDIAMLRLKTPVTTIKPVAYIDGPEAEAKWSPPGKMAKVLGWGDMDADDGPGKWPNKLMQVDLPVMSNATCQGYPGFEGVTDNMLCAGYETGLKDACQGDSGGPLFVYDKAGKRYLQTGVVSWGYGCAQPNEPGVYTRVSRFGPWIKEQIAKP